MEIETVVALIAIVGGMASVLFGSLGLVIGYYKYSSIVSSKYMTKEECEQHMRNCPMLPRVGHMKEQIDSHQKFIGDTRAKLTKLCVDIEVIKVKLNIIDSEQVLADALRMLRQEKDKDKK